MLFVPLTIEHSHVQEGRVAELPEPTTQLPRAKPLPKPRAPTKWEIFAQRKGITKHKRSKDVWDEEAGEYKRRFGYKRAGDESEVPIIEASASDQVGSDSVHDAPQAQGHTHTRHISYSSPCVG